MTTTGVTDGKTLHLRPWLCPKAGGFQRRPSKGILQGIQSVGQLIIDDYAGFATSDGVLTLVPSFTDASGHSCPGFVRIYDDNGRWLALSLWN